MGNNLSTAVAIIFMSHIENQILKQLPNIRIWLRYIDDIFVVFEGTPPQELLAICNDIHSNISFTLEEAQNSTLPFLDVSVTVQDKHFVTTLYSKLSVHTVEPKPKKVFLSLPFISEMQAREVRRTINKCGLKDMLCISFKSRPITSVLAPRREPLCTCLLYTSPSPRDLSTSRMPSSA